MRIVFIFFGGAIGSLIRYFMGEIINQFQWLKVFDSNFPFSTMTINLVGSFLIGIFASLLSDELISENIKLFVITGILGGFTTFSAFSLENLNLIIGGYLFKAIIYIFISVFLGVLFAYLGYMVVSDISIK